MKSGLSPRMPGVKNTLLPRIMAGMTALMLIACAAVISIADMTGCLAEYSLWGLCLLGLGLAVILVSWKVLAEGLARTDEGIRNMADRSLQAELNFEKVLRESETGFVLLERESGRIRRANKRALEFFGAARPEAVDLGRLRPLPAAHPLQRTWRETGSGKPLLSLPGEQEAYCECTSFFIGRNEEFECLAVLDVTKTVLLQSEKRRHASFLQKVIDQLPSVVCIKDSELRLVLYNAAFDKLFGEGGDMLGMVRHTEWLGNDMDVILADDRAALDLDEPLTVEFDCRTPEGEDHTHLLGRLAIKGEDGKRHLLTVATDITDRRRTERELALLHERAEAASVAKTEFLAGMSHEMRTPLNVILGMAQLALAAGPSDTLANQLMKIRDAANKLLEQITDILEYAESGSSPREPEQTPFSLEDLLWDVAGETEEKIGNRPIRFETDIPSFPGLFRGDPGRLGKALLNLLHNAVKYTDSGFIRLSCELREERRERSQLYFSIEDSGIGIPEERMDRLLAGYQQSEGVHAHGGPGLGLAMTRHLIYSLGGVIGLHSEQGMGSNFFFTLWLDKVEPGGPEDKTFLPPPEWFTSPPDPPPDRSAGPGDGAAGQERARAGRPGPKPSAPRPSAPKQFGPKPPGPESSAPKSSAPKQPAPRQPAPERPAPERPAPAKPFFGGRRVLVAEDNAINQEIILEVLRDYGIEVTLADNGLEARDLVLRNDYDLVFMDLQMPVMDGLSAARSIRRMRGERFASLPIVALTANALQQDRRNCEEAGMNGFVGKPFDLSTLEETLAKWLGPPERREAV